jgi:hypothetical protein
MGLSFEERSSIGNQPNIIPHKTNPELSRFSISTLKGIVK